jgi:hypothetical protein
MNINLLLELEVDHKGRIPLQEGDHKGRIPLQEGDLPLLKKITNLPDVLIKKVYEYMTGKEKYICNKKYDFLENMIKGDCHNGYKFFLYIKYIIDSLTKNQLLLFIKMGSLKYHPFIINKIWYFSRDTGKYYDGEVLLSLWEEESLHYENVKTVDCVVKKRIQDVIYYYFISTIRQYEKKISILLALNEEGDFCSIFNKLDSLFYLYKSLEIIHSILHK